MQQQMQQQMQQMHPLESFYPGITEAAGAPRIERDGVIAEWAPESQEQEQKTVRLTIPGVASNIALPETRARQVCEVLARLLHAALPRNMSALAEQSSGGQTMRSPEMANIFCAKCQEFGHTQWQCTADTS